MNKPLRLPQRIVLCGVSRSGKSTLGDNLEALYGYKQMAFADPLKRAAQSIFGFRDEHLWGPSHTRETPYPEFVDDGFCFECNGEMQGPERHFASGLRFEDLQEQVLKRVDDPDYWWCPGCETTRPRYVSPRTALQTLGTGWGRKLCPELWVKSCFRSMDAARRYVVTDGRFRNELVEARNHGACCVLLLRGLQTSTSHHPSEADVRHLAETRKEHGLFHVVFDNETGSSQDNFQRLVTELRIASEEGWLKGVALQSVEVVP